MTERAADGLVVARDPAYHGLRATSPNVNAVFPGQTDPARFVRRYEVARHAVMAVYRQRWEAYSGADNISEAALDALVQEIVIDWFYFHNINYRRVRIRTGRWFNDLTHPQTYRLVQRAAGRGDLGAALAGLTPAEWEQWARGNDAFENR